MMAAQMGEPTERTWLEAQRDSWSRPREWTAWNLVALASMVGLLALMAVWLTRPGGTFGGAEPLGAGSLFADHSRGYYVYQLFELPNERTDRLRATMQSALETRRSQTEADSLTFIFVKRDTDPSAFISGETGAARLQAEDVVGWLKATGGTCEAAGRSSATRQQEPLSVRC